LRISSARSIDHAHPAAPDFPEDLVIADAPFRTANINFLKHLIPMPSIFAIALESLLKDATETIAVSDARRRPASFARRDIASNLN
jgi:hypothetical protein